jgi:hypothetical protein
MALWAKRLPMQVAGHQGPGLKDDIFLKVLCGFLHGRQVLGLAMGAGRRSRHPNGPVNMVGLGPHPSRMSYRRPALFLDPLVGQRGLFDLLSLCLRVFVLIRLELPSMQGLKFGPQFGILPFQPPDPLVPDFYLAIKPLDDA